MAAFSRVLALLALLGLAAPASAQLSLLTENETRVAALRDDLRRMQRTLTEGADAFSRQISSALRDNPEWAAISEDYFARRTALVKRAAALDDRVTAVQAKTGPDNAADIKKRLDKLGKPFEVLRSDYEFYTRLPLLALGQDRAAAQATMRLLASREDYPEALAFFLSRTPGRAPFAHMPAGVTLIRPR